MASRTALVLMALLPLACGGTASGLDTAMGGTGGSAAGGTGGVGPSGGVGGIATGGTGATGNVCQLPADPGTCEASMPMYYFDSALGQCAPFVYGGCEGNGNRFATALDCVDACGGAVPDFCSLPPDPGSCDGYFPSYYFDAATGHCELFDWGGCDDNGNRFATEVECLATCGDVSAAQCPLQQPTGACTTEFEACTYGTYDLCLCIPHDAYWCEAVPACSAPVGTGGSSGFAPPMGGTGTAGLPATGGAASDLPAPAGGGASIMPAPSTTTCTCLDGVWQCEMMF